MLFSKRSLQSIHVFNANTAQLGWFGDVPETLSSSGKVLSKLCICGSPCGSHFRTTKGWDVKVMHYTDRLRGVQLLLKHHARAEKVSGHRDQAMRRLLFIVWLYFNQSCQAPSSTRMCPQTPNRIPRRAQWCFIGTYVAGDSCGRLEFLVLKGFLTTVCSNVTAMSCKIYMFLFFSYLTIWWI